ncbi:hypothetical protein [Cysteiniphilum sp. QT6929]|uniref:hypothetical protein n=1 Tax=Cysteiniphilum sp. QT6929 TaxID=2975055 RepID=UPI0024B3B7E0|nr:hypothetical protein [Cysteiniphilum sp. QT6929]WHN66776.1 hypothetical protein NYP54_11530 [Cysteiniphilum sp. QT6929]
MVTDNQHNNQSLSDVQRKEADLMAKAGVPLSIIAKVLNVPITDIEYLKSVKNDCE